MNVVKWVLFTAGYCVVSMAALLLPVSAIHDLICWKAPITTPLTITVVVLYSFIAAPGHRIPITIGGYLVGLFGLYQLPDMHWYPECHAQAYEPTSLPVVFVCLAGLMTLVVVWICTAKR